MINLEKNNQVNNTKEERSIKITLEQAREWYESGNNTLRALALSAFTEDEITFSLNYIYNKVRTISTSITIPKDEEEKYYTLADLALIAKFFNNSWKKTMANTGYFISKKDPFFEADDYNGFSVLKHNDIIHAGMVYFKNKEDAIKAIKLLGDRLNALFAF